MQEAKIKFDHVTKVFETRSQTITAVKDYSMEIQAGEFNPGPLRLRQIHSDPDAGRYH